MSNKNILWKKITECPKYEISTEGEIRNIEKKNILKQYEDSKNGMYKVKLLDNNGKQVMRYISFLMAKTFVEKDYRYSSRFVKNKDGDKSNNALRNIKVVKLSDEKIKVEKPLDVKFYYYRSHGGYRVYDALTKKFFDQNKLMKNGIEKIRFLPKKYEASDNGLLEYSNDYKKWTDEIKDYVDYNFYFTDYLAVKGMYMKYKPELYSDYTKVKIRHKEYLWFEKCVNCGIMYLDNEYIDKEFTGYGFDFSGFYMMLMTHPDFYIPINKGKAYILDALPSVEELEYGFYNVKITCQNPKFCSVFAFNPKNVYTHFDLKVAMKYAKQFDVKIQLIDNGEKGNVYLYEEKDLILGKSFFGKWAKQLRLLKNNFPKNKLVKHLSSSLWGALVQYLHVNKTYKEIQDEELSVGYDEGDYIIIDKVKKKNDQEYFKLIKTDNISKENIRLKPFLTSFGRYYIGQVAMLDVDSVVRIHTDGIIFNKNVIIPKQFQELGLISDEKISGKMKFKNIMKDVLRDCDMGDTNMDDFDGVEI